jgi:putative tryptophan/tyrosine transport system substrate-binding protein
MRSILVVLALLLASSAIAAGQRNKIPHIGYLTAPSPAANAVRIEAFRRGLIELGYMEGSSIKIEWRSAEGKLDRLPEIASELARLKLDLIVTGGPQSTRAAKHATTSIPIIMAFDNDPVGNGFIESLARPGGNITGLSTHYPEISGKQLELLKEIVPKLSRVAVLGNSSHPGNGQALKETEIAAAALAIQLQYLDIREAKDIETAFRSANKANAALLLENAVFNPERAKIAALAAKSRLPAIYPQNEYIDAGGLMYYGANTSDLFRRAATYVDKILKGRKAADLPVEQPIKFELVINLKAAKQIGLEIPQWTLMKADRVIK